MEFSISAACIASLQLSSFLRDKLVREMCSPTGLEQLHDFSSSTSFSTVKATCSKNMDCSVVSVRPLGDSEVHMNSIKLPSRSGSSTAREPNFYDKLLQKIPHINDHHISSPLRKAVQSCTRGSPVGIAAVSLMMGASIGYSCAGNSGSIKHSPVSTGAPLHQLYWHAPARECVGLPTEDQEKANAPVYVVNHYYGSSIIEVMLGLSIVSLPFLLLFRRS